MTPTVFMNWFLFHGIIVALMPTHTHTRVRIGGDKKKKNVDGK